jgi:hypothetical protein
MDNEKYRKWYLSENWGQNSFIMVTQSTLPRQHFSQDTWQHRVGNRWNHPLVNSGKAYWLNHQELCIGYELVENSEIFRPIFSHKRQRLLDRLHKYDEINEKDKGHTIDNPYKFWNKIKTKYFNELYKIKCLPVDCVRNISKFIW